MNGIAPTFLIVLGAGLLAASVWDLRARKVPNLINLLLLVAGVAAQVASNPTQWRQGLSHAALGVLVAFALVAVPFGVGVLRGGDAKLLVATGAWMGPVGALDAFLLGLIFGGVGAFIVWLTSPSELRTEVVNNLRAMLLLGRPIPIEARPDRRHVPMAVPLSLAIAVTFFG